MIHSRFFLWDFFFLRHQFFLSFREGNISKYVGLWFQSCLLFKICFYFLVCVIDFRNNKKDRISSIYLTHAQKETHWSLVKFFVFIYWTNILSAYCRSGVILCPGNTDLCFSMSWEFWSMFWDKKKKRQNFLLHGTYIQMTSWNLQSHTFS